MPARSKRSPPTGAETFYRGALARRLAKALPECGTLVAEADLAEFEAEIQQPIGIDYRGFRVLQAPPNSTGFVVLQELKIAENFDLAAHGRSARPIWSM